MGHCEGLGSAEPSQQRNPNMHPVSTKYVNAGPAEPRLLETHSIVLWFWHFHLDDVVPGVALVFDHCPPVMYAGVVSMIPVRTGGIGDNV